MKHGHQSLPQAREQDLVIQELPDELLIYDLDRHRSHCLNRTAALVWKHCDGKTGVAELAAMLQRETGASLGEEAVWLALERLGRAHLLTEQVVSPLQDTRASRRVMIRKLAVTGGLALVSSILAPEAAHAQTPCSAATNCGTNRCCCRRQTGQTVTITCQPRTSCAGGNELCLN